MKKWIALAAVCVLLALGLSFPVRRGAAPEPPVTTEVPTVPVTTAAPTEPAAPEEPERLTELAGPDIRPEEDLAGLAARPGEAAVLLARLDQRSMELRYRVLLADPADAAVTASVELAPFPGQWGQPELVLTEEELLLVDAAGERCAAFDRSGTFLGCRDYPVMSADNLGWQNPLIGGDLFWKERDHAEYSDVFSQELGHVLGFYDETDRLCVLREPYDSVSACLGHRLLVQHFPEGGPRLVYRLLDLDAGLCLDQVEFEPSPEEPDSGVNPSYAVMCEEWVLIGLDRGSAELPRQRVMLWRPGTEDPRPLDWEPLTRAWLNSQLSSLCNTLKSRGLTIHLDEAPDPALTPTTGLAAAENVCETGCSLFGEYRILSQLKAFTDKLPGGFLRELYSDMPGAEPWNRDSLHIYLVRSIPGDAAAFANAWTEPMMICFATEEYNATHPAHELMHIIDFRLSQYFYTQRRDMEDEWLALSPYYGYNTDLSEAQEAQLEQYFVSLYASTNTAEDRAETFQMLFDCQEPLSEARWYAEHPGIQAKVKWLTDSIRAAFPSVQAVEQAWWEKPVE